MHTEIEYIILNIGALRSVVYVYSEAVIRPERSTFYRPGGRLRYLFRCVYTAAD